MFSKLITALLIVASVAQKNPYFAANRNTIIHLFEWKWIDIANECEAFLQNTAYGGVQVSPPNENLIVSTRPWWERYQPVSYNLTSRSGTEAEFSDMVTRCNKVGIRIYVDAVINHMAGEPGTGTAGNKALSDVKIFPALPYNPVDFHPTCDIKDYVNPETIRNCELKNRRDLDQSSSYVQDKIVSYLNALLDLGVAGFRIDSAKYIWPNDLQAIIGKIRNLDTNSGFAANSRPFIYQDVPIFSPEFYSTDVVRPEEYTDLGTVEAYNTSAALSRVFSGKLRLKTLENWGPNWGFIKTNSDALVYLDDHVNQRKASTLTYNSLKQHKMAIAFLLAHTYGGVTRVLSSYYFSNADIGPPQDTDGNIKSPIIYSDGSCGNGYVCEHRLPQIVNMVGFRDVVAGTNVENWWSNDDQIAFSRGNRGFIAFSNGGDLVENIKTSLPSGTYCDVISGNLVSGRCTEKSVRVDASGVAAVSILKNDFDGVVAIHASSKVA